MALKSIATPFLGDDAVTQFKLFYGMSSTKATILCLMLDTLLEYGNEPLSMKEMYEHDHQLKNFTDTRAMGQFSKTWAAKDMIPLKLAKRLSSGHKYQIDFDALRIHGNPMCRRYQFGFRY